MLNYQMGFVGISWENTATNEKTASKNCTIFWIGFFWGLVQSGLPPPLEVGKIMAYKPIVSI
jgi:hypothetical protein